MGGVRENCKHGHILYDVQHSENGNNQMIIYRLQIVILNTVLSPTKLKVLCRIESHNMHFYSHLPIHIATPLAHATAAAA